MSATTENLVREKLEKQLELLSEHSQSGASDINQLSHSMAEIANILLTLPKPIKP